MDCTLIPAFDLWQVDIKEVGEALSSAMKVMETISVHVEKFIPKVKIQTPISFSNDYENLNYLKAR